MKQFIGGNGLDTTAAARTYLAAHKELWLANLILIGDSDDPAANWLTDFESPLMWSCWGTFNTTVITRGTITSKVGLEVESLDLVWSPKNTVLTASMATANPYQLGRLGAYANKRVRIWRCMMPEPGDANTFGAYELFGGFIGDTKVETGKITFSVNSYLYVLNQKVPSGVIEVTDTLASYTGFTPPSGFSVIPQFSVFAGSNTTVLICDQISPDAGNIPSGNAFADACVVFNGGAGATLQGQYSIIGTNGAFKDGNGNSHTSITLFSPLPWAPTPGVDTFFIASAPKVSGDQGFPYVPSGQTAV